MKILALADIHLSGEGFGTPQHEAIMKIPNSLIEERGIDLVVVCGDVYDTVSTVNQRLAFKRFLDGCLDYCPVVVLRGNHDQKGDLAAFDGLQGVHGECHVIDDRPDYRHIRGLGLDIFGLPHIGLANLAQLHDSKGQAAEDGREALQAILTHWVDVMASSSAPSLVLLHGVVAGAQLDNGYIPRDNGLHVTAGQLDALGCPVLCGHYHKHQQVGQQAWYVGSPARNSYGEAEGDKGCLIIEHDGQQWLEPEFVSLDPQRMVLVEYRWQAGEWCGIKEASSHDIMGARVRVRYHVPEDELAQATEALPSLLEWFEAAAEVKVERIIESVTVARCADMAQAQTVEEGLFVWLEQGGRNPDDYLPTFNRIMNQEEEAPCNLPA